MSVGYARVSPQEQDLALQLDALQTAGCARIYTEKASGAQRDRPQLQAALDYMRADDTLVVWKLDRLARSLRQLLETVEALHARQMGLRSLTEAIVPAPRVGHSSFIFLGHSRNLSAPSSGSGRVRGSRRRGSAGAPAADRQRSLQPTSMPRARS
jgi:DNA invertase Pin-like site-specific DNA recombinase